LLQHQRHDLHARPSQARDYDQWADITGDARWRWDNALPYFKLHEDHHAGANASHGAKGHKSDVLLADTTVYGETLRHHIAGGEWRVEKQRLRWDVLDAFAQAAVEAGIPATDDFNRGNNEGVGYFEVNQKSGWRWNTAKAFIRPACYARPNFELWSSAQVSKLVISTDADGKQHCTGVEVWTGQEHITVTAKHSVVLSAGAIGTPQILQLSGLGPAELLKQHGIEPVIDLPGVGANLQDHLQIRSVFKVQGVDTLNTLASSWWGKAKIGLEYAFNRSGPMSMAPSQLGAFTRSSPDQPYPNIEYHVQPLSLDAFGEPLHSFNAFTASVCNLNPTSRGTVNITSANFADAPKIAPNYLSTEADRKVAADSLRVTRRIAAQPALAKYKPEEYKPGVQYQTDEDLARLAGDIATTIFHPVGTARMGRVDDAMAVVDPELRVRDGRGGVVRGLRVVDASVMPTITSGNTNSPTLMMAEKAAQWLAHEAVQA
jgi:choline dehydrogenase